MLSSGVLKAFECYFSPKFMQAELNKAAALICSTGHMFDPSFKVYTV